MFYSSAVSNHVTRYMSVMSLNLIKGFRESHSGHQQLRFTRNYMGANGGPEEDHQLDHCCWTGREGKREEERLPLLPQARNFTLLLLLVGLMYGFEHDVCIVR